jgi:hypothetical protein
VNILLDHCVDWRLARSLPAHQIRTAGEMGWHRMRNGKLLSTAAGQFDVFLTTDQNIKHQQNPATLPIAIIVLIAKSNKLSELLVVVQFEILIFSGTVPHSGQRSGVARRS